MHPFKIAENRGDCCQDLMSDGILIEQFEKKNRTAYVILAFKAVYGKERIRSYRRKAEMSDFASLQHNQGKKTPATASSLSVLRPVRDFASEEATPVPEGTVSPDWQAVVAHVEQSGHSISRMAIHHEEVMQQVSASISEQREENRTGLPDALKAGVEKLSGYSLNDIRVHYNSPQPAEMGALAYTQGTEIHMGPGQEQHLAHEAWHVVQQKQGRVKPTLQTKGVAINDDEALEREADVMGARAGNGAAHTMPSMLEVAGNVVTATAPIQGVWGTVKGTENKLQLRDLAETSKEGKKLYLLSKSGEVYVEVGYDMEGLIVAKTGEVREAAKKSTTKALSGSKRKTATDKDEEEEEEEDKESKGKKVKENQAGTIRDIFKQYLQKYKISDKLVSAIVVDLDLEGANLDYITILKKSSEKEIASCFDTAKRLLELIGDPASDAMNTWENKGTVKEGMPKLLDDIEAHQDSACIYRVGIGGTAHGFAIVVQNKSAEVLQGFAGPSGESLAENILERKGLYSIDQIKAHLQNLIGSDEQASFNSQKELFSEPIDIEKIPLSDKKKIKEAEANPNYRRANAADEKKFFKGFAAFYRDLNADVFQWERRGLYSQEEMQKRIKAKIVTGLEALK